MKKIVLIVALIALGASLVSAQMEATSFSALSTVGASTNSKSYVLRGTLEGVYINVGTPTTRTQTVTIASSQQTLFSLAATADGWYPLQYAQYGSTGSALTFNTYGATNVAAGASVAYAQTWYGKAPLAGTITVTVVGGNDAAVTNTTEAIVVFSK